MSESAGSGSSSLRVTPHRRSPVVTELEVEVDQGRVAKAFDRAYRTLAKRARVPGFRPGKVPRSILEKRFGAGVAEEIERTLVAETLPEAVEQSGIEPVTEPSIEAGPPSADAAFRYTAQIEVKPEVELRETEGLPAKRPKAEVAEPEVLEKLEELRQQHATLLEEPEGTTAAEGHVLKVDFQGRIDGEPFPGGKGEGISIEIGSGQFIPGFEEQLVGATAGETREVRVTFPEDYGNEQLAGREAVFEVTVTGIQRRELPELDDELAKDVGDFESLAELRDRIRSDLQAGRDRTADQVLDRTLGDALIERNPVEVPPGLIDRALQSRLRAAHRRLENAVPHDALHAQLARWEEEWRPDAEREVKLSLLLDALADQQDLRVDDEEVQAHLERLAQEQGVEAGRLVKAYREAGVLESVRAELRERKALEWLRSQAKIEEESGT